MTIELRAGTTITGKYRIERELGRGAVGVVYAAEHLETGKRVALKCVDASHAIDPASAERLVREAQAAARVRHSNVVDIYDVGRDDKLLFLVMEYLEGEPLSTVIERNDLPVHKLVALLLPAMRGVAEAHRQGVVHRDIKPENIFFARQVDVGEPIAKVLDFGISKLDVRGRPLRSLTADGFAIGTPGYMAYEQAMGDKTIDGRADVYAFGAILYEALTGRVPHTADDFSALARHFLTQTVPTPNALGASVPESLSALVMWAIERDRDQRVSSMESLIRELEPFASERTYQVEHDTSSPRPAASAMGKTLVGPWGMNKVPIARSDAEQRGQATTLAPTTVEAVMWLKRSRQQRTRKLLWQLGLPLLAVGVIVFSLGIDDDAQEQPPLRPAQHSISAATSPLPSAAPAEAVPAVRDALPDSGQAEPAAAQAELEAAQAAAPLVEPSGAPKLVEASGTPKQAVPVPLPATPPPVPARTPVAQPKLEAAAASKPVAQPKLEAAAVAKPAVPAAPKLAAPSAVGKPPAADPSQTASAPAVAKPLPQAAPAAKPATKPRDFGIY